MFFFKNLLFLIFFLQTYYSIPMAEEIKIPPILTTSSFKKLGIEVKSINSFKKTDQEKEGGHTQGGIFLDTKTNSLSLIKEGNEYESFISCQAEADLYSKSRDAINSTIANFLFRMISGNSSTSTDGLAIRSNGCIDIVSKLIPELTTLEKIAFQYNANLGDELYYQNVMDFIKNNKMKEALNSFLTTLILGESSINLGSLGLIKNDDGSYTARKIDFGEVDPTRSTRYFTLYYPYEHFLRKKNKILSNCFEMDRKLAEFYFDTIMNKEEYEHFVDRFLSLDFTGLQDAFEEVNEVFQSLDNKIIALRNNSGKKSKMPPSYFHLFLKRIEAFKEEILEKSPDKAKLLPLGHPLYQKRPFNLTFMKIWSKLIVKAHRIKKRRATILMEITREEKALSLLKKKLDVEHRKVENYEKRVEGKLKFNKREQEKNQSLFQQYSASYMFYKKQTKKKKKRIEELKAKFKLK